MLQRAYVPPEVRFRGTGTPVYIPSPTAGLNTRDAFQDMQPVEARVLENFDPEGSGVRIRPGFTSHSTSAGSSTSVTTLHVWEGGTPVLMAAASNGRIYNVTGATAAQLATGYSENYWQTEFYNGWSFWVNGTDTPFRFDGTSTAATGFSGSGLTLSNLDNVASVKNRLWFTEKDQVDVWYGGAAAVTGTLTKFQLSQVSQGGTCTAIGGWSRDGGDGPDDYNVFVMSTGEVLIYGGDPATTFAIVGRFSSPAPVGKRCLVQYGGALAVITKQGIIPLDAIVAGTAFDPFNQNVAQVGKLAPSFESDFRNYGTNSGWAGAFNAGKIYVNVPTSATTSHQYVFNTRNGTWTKYTNLPVASLVSYQSDVYFGGTAASTVWRLSDTNDDNGSSIIAKARGAFIEPFGGRAGSYNAVRHRLTGQGTVTGKFGLDIDYMEKGFSSDTKTLIEATDDTPWGSAWGSAWSSGDVTDPEWYSSIGHGRAVGVNIEAYGNGEETYFHGTDVMAQVGGFL